MAALQYEVSQRAERCATAQGAVGSYRDAVRAMIEGVTGHLQELGRKQHEELASLGQGLTTGKQNMEFLLGSAQGSLEELQAVFRS